MDEMVAALALTSQLLSSPAVPMIDATALKADLAVLRQALTTIHPGLYRYQSPAQFEAEIKGLERRFSKGATQAEVFLALSAFTAKIRCGHTFPSFWNQRDETHANLFLAKDKLPIAFRWLGGKMIVTRNDSKSNALKPGTMIKKINDVPSEVVLKTLLQLVKADGRNDAKRVAELQLQGLNEWEAFDIYYSLAYRPTEKFKLDVIQLDGSQQSIVVDAVDHAAREAMRASLTPNTNEDSELWKFTWTRPDMAVLTMPNWVLYNSKWNWKEYLRSRFIELQAKGATSLVLDIRGNAGGNECGDEIMRYLVPERRSVPADLTYVKYQKLPADLEAHVRTWDRSYYDWSRISKPAGPVKLLNTTAYQIRSDVRDATIFPATPRFRGKVYVLVDAENSSATFQFAQQMRRFKVGTLVGQPTGGSRRGINGGAIFFTTLPNSGIEIDIPIIASVPTTDQPDEGLVPDVVIQDSRADIATGRDSVMEWVLRQKAPVRGKPSVSGQ